MQKSVMQKFVIQNFYPSCIQVRKSDIILAYKGDESMNTAIKLVEGLVKILYYTLEQLMRRAFR